MPTCVQGVRPLFLSKNERSPRLQALSERAYAVSPQRVLLSPADPVSSRLWGPMRLSRCCVCCRRRGAPCSHALPCPCRGEGVPATGRFPHGGHRGRARTPALRTHAGSGPRFPDPRSGSLLRVARLWRSLPGDFGLLSSSLPASVLSAMCDVSVCTLP